MNNPQNQFEQIESNIADEISFIIRWRTSKHYFSGEENLGSEYFGRLKTDLQGAFETASIIRLATFFQDGSNSLQRFINLAKDLNKIDKPKHKSLNQRIKELISKNDCKTLHNLRRKVFAHWDESCPEHPDHPIDITSIIEEIVSIFEASGGRRIDRGILERDVKKGWQDFLKKL